MNPREEAILAIALTAIAIIPGTLAAIFLWLGHRQAKSVNDAVNHRHPGKPRLYDEILNAGELARENRLDVKDLKADVKNLVDWRESYRESPWKDGEGVKSWLKEYEERTTHCNREDCPRKRDKP